MNNLDPEIQAEIEILSKIPAITSMLEVICRTTGMGFSAVARVTETQWITCVVRDEIAFGLVPGSELQLQTTICDEIRQHHNPVVIDHVALDPAFANHHTPAMYGFQSYISVPIMLKNGEFFGTLCAIDPRPNVLNTTAVTEMFKLFADLIAFHLNAAEQLKISEAKIAEQQKIAELRELFIAVLGHDLRNPVGAMTNVAQLMARMPLDDRMKRLANIILDSSYRMKGLIENILDFASGRLGEGIILNYTTDGSLQTTLEQIITEQQLLWPDRVIQTSFSINQPIAADYKRLAQLFANLLDNAFKHSKKEGVVKIEAFTTADEMLLKVSNDGEKIPKSVMPYLFQPFTRSDVKQGQQGLGLGLYIAAQIASAHNGLMEVTTNDEQTTFTLRMPLSRETSAEA